MEPLLPHTKIYGPCDINIDAISRLQCDRRKLNDSLLVKVRVLSRVLIGESFWASFSASFRASFGVSFGARSSANAGASFVPSFGVNFVASYYFTCSFYLHVY